MDQEQTFYEQPVDHTPYTAFIWVIGIALILFAASAYGVWKLGGWAKSRSFAVETNRSGATDALLDQGASALDQARSAANQAAQKAAYDAAAAATQELLKQQDAAIKAGEDAAKEEVKNQADIRIQQFINQ